MLLFELENTISILPVFKWDFVTIPTVLYVLFFFSLFYMYVYVRALIMDKQSCLKHHVIIPQKPQGYKHKI